MGTGASIQNPENVGGDNAPNQAKKLVRGPVPIDGKPYVYYPSQCSASIRPNNLSAFGDTLLFTSKNRVVFVETGKPRLKNCVFRADGVVYQTKARAHCFFVFPSSAVFADTRASALKPYHNGVPLVDLQLTWLIQRCMLRDCCDVGMYVENCWSKPLADSGGRSHIWTCAVELRHAAAHCQTHTFSKRVQRPTRSICTRHMLFSQQNLRWNFDGYVPERVAALPRSMFYIFVI